MGPFEEVPKSGGISLAKGGDSPPAFADTSRSNNTTSNANGVSTVQVQQMSATQTEGMLYLIIALVLFCVGLFTFLWICLWPIALIFLILGLLKLMAPPPQQVATV